MSEEENSNEEKEDIGKIPRMGTIVMKTIQRIIKTMNIII